MKGSVAFEQASDLLTKKSALTNPQARGAIHLALKEGGLDARQVAAHELAAVFRTLMPLRLRAQGLSVERAQDICQEIAGALSNTRSEATGEDAAAMFDRLDQARRR